MQGRTHSLRGGGAAPKRSTLSYARAHRPQQLFEAVFRQLLGRCLGIAAPKKPFRFKNKLYSLGASVIGLCLSRYDWDKFRRAKGAVKLHLLLDHDGCLPSYAVISKCKTHEISMARALQPPAGAIVAMDRGYVDYLFLDSFTKQPVFLVTRLKNNAAFSLAGQWSALREKILADDLSNLAGSGKSHLPQQQMRRVVVWDEVGGRQIVLLTNNRKLSAVTIAASYKQHWQIELFFKALKQNLKIKNSVGTIINAVRIQIWTALIAILLLKFLQLRSHTGWSLSNLIALLRLNLFVHHDLWTWLDTPFDGPPDPPALLQPTFHFA